MTTPVSYFSSLDIKETLATLAAKVRAENSVVNATGREPPLAQLQSVVNSMTSRSAEWDSLCQFTIQRYGSTFRSELLKLLETSDPNVVDVTQALMLMFIVELDLSISNELSDELRNFKETVIERFSGRSDRAGVIVKFSLNQLPLAILKSILNSEEIGSIKNIDNAANSIRDKISAWDSTLSKHEEKVSELETTLKAQEHAYNFVSLNKGFAKMEATVQSELATQKKNMKIFGGLMFVPAVTELILILSGRIIFSSANAPSLIVSGIISLTCTAILLYFFRIVLRDADSKDAQLIQIRLRMNLCQFIQDYASYASEIKQKNPDALSKFESLIFSGIVGTQDKLPSTFEGLEQLGSLIKTARGG